MLVRRLSEDEARRCAREAESLRPGLRPGRLDVDPERAFVLTCATDASSLASAAHREPGQPSSLPEHSTVVMRQMNADPELVADFLARECLNIRHLVVGLMLPAPAVLVAASNVQSDASAVRRRPEARPAAHPLARTTVTPSVCAGTHGNPYRKRYVPDNPECFNGLHLDNTPYPPPAREDTHGSQVKPLSSSSSSSSSIAIKASPIAYGAWTMQAV